MLRDGDKRECSSEKPDASRCFSPYDAPQPADGVHNYMNFDDVDRQIKSRSQMLNSF